MPERSDPEITQIQTADVTPEPAPVEASSSLAVVDRPRKVYSGMWGVPEIAAVSVSSLVLLLVVVVYFFWVIPSNRELARNKADAERLEADVATARTKYGSISDSQTQVEKLVTSVDDFETRFLPVVSTGESALYQRLNSLISAYDLVNTNGPDYVPLETVDAAKPQQQSDEEKGRSKFKSLYPGVYVSTTLEGSYQNLRRFIRDIETGRDFVIVSSVELAPSDTERKDDAERPNGVPNVRNAGPQVGNPNLGPNPAGNPNMKGLGMAMGPAPIQNAGTRSAKQTGKTRGEVVSLHIELAAYFRRPQSGAAATQ